MHLKVNNTNHVIHIVKSKTIDLKRQNIVFIHGFMGTSLIYSQFFKFLSQEKFNIFSIDIPGMALSHLDSF